MGDALSLLVALVAQPAVCWWIVRRDQRFLSAASLECTWNEASLLAAVFAFGPLAVLVHYLKARRGFRGVLPGLLWASLALFVSGLGSWTLGTLAEHLESAFAAQVPMSQPTPD